MWVNHEGPRRCQSESGAGGWPTAISQRRKTPKSPLLHHRWVSCGAADVYTTLTEGWDVGQWLCVVGGLGVMRQTVEKCLWDDGARCWLLAVSHWGVVPPKQRLLTACPMSCPHPLVTLGGPGGWIGPWGAPWWELLTGVCGEVEEGMDGRMREMWRCFRVGGQMYRWRYWGCIDRND